MIAPGIQIKLFDEPASWGLPERADGFKKELLEFCAFGKQSLQSSMPTGDGKEIPIFINEFWTAKQRAASSLHEISYRACFKPQLPRFFIQRFTLPGDTVYDPFMGRGTTLLEAALLGRRPCGCDVNPLSEILIRPRLQPPRFSELHERIRRMNFTSAEELPEDLLTFYHPDTLSELCALRNYLLRKRECHHLDGIDLWIWMVATNRLTGHSPGFFSVYTMPPNQAVSVESQRKINLKRSQIPPYRNVPELILRKSRQLLKDIDDAMRRALIEASTDAALLTGSADNTPCIESESVSLVVTSPPFLDIVDYNQDNWLRSWFCGIDTATVAIWQIKSVEAWEECMKGVLHELRRILKTKGLIAFEVGEVRNGTIKLENSVIKAGLHAGLTPVLVLINEQIFTKTANCWGVNNLKKGTNTNRIVLFQKN